MNVDEATRLAGELKKEPEWSRINTNLALVVLAAEVERLRAELDTAKADVEQLRGEYISTQRTLTDTWERAEVLEKELAAAKAANVCPVNLSWCYESNECDIVITGMSDEDSTKFGNWLRDRMKERGEG